MTSIFARLALQSLILTSIFSLFSLNIVRASASIPEPSFKPEVPNISTLLSDRDAKLFRGAVSDARRGKWSDVYKARNALSNSTAKDALIWLRATRDRKAPFSELSYVHKNLSNWPRMTTVRAKAEKRLNKELSEASQVLDWFQQSDPVSGEGRLALAEAHFESGDVIAGEKWLKLAWREARLDRETQRAIYKKYKRLFTKDDHAARADYLVWEGRRYFPMVQGLLSLMPKDNRALINARMLLRTNGRGMNAAVDAIPARLQGDAGFGYERGYWRRKRKSKDYALSTFLKIDQAPKTEKGKSRLWRERKIMAYWSIEEENYKDAYALTQNHGMTRGAEFASAEFLAGWLALTKLNNPSVALKHFTILQENVGMPVSLSRASYWQGRAAEAMNDPNATSYYAEAAQYVNTFFGQLASDKLSGRLSQLTLPPEPVRDFERASFNADNRVMAARLFAEAGSELFFTQMAFFLDDDLDSPAKISLLSELAKDFGYMRPSIRASKQAGRLKTMLTESGYPFDPAIESIDPKFEKAFVYAIARQESEFNVSAVSHANAYGLMQMINATARSTARKHRIHYSKSLLTTDKTYSANLGAHHLHDLLQDFDGSYIMAAAAYNAGASRVHRWNRRYGDPRKGEIDPIDWIESLPFAETRNYIQRIIENMQVYKARLNGNTIQNQIHEDLYLGSKNHR